MFNAIAFNFFLIFAPFCLFGGGGQLQRSMMSLMLVMSQHRLFDILHEDFVTMNFFSYYICTFSVYFI